MKMLAGIEKQNTLYIMCYVIILKELFLAIKNKNF